MVQEKKPKQPIIDEDRERKALQAGYELAPWMLIAHRYRGLREVTIDASGHRALNDTVRDMFRFTRFPPHLINLKTNWCAAAACTWLEIAGVESPKSAAARDFMHWGVALKAFVFGAVLVFDRADPTNPNAAHVGFCERVPVLPTTPDVLTFGGNQDNSACAALKKTEKLIGIRWPSGWPVPPEALR